MIQRLAFVLGLLVASIAFIATASPAGAQYNQPDTITVTPSAPPGGTITVQACCYQTQTPVIIFAGWTPVGYGTVDMRGTATGTATLPNSSRPGTDVTITVFGIPWKTLRATVHVLDPRAAETPVAAASPPPARSLPATGNSTSLWLSGAGAALVAGGGFLVLALRRRSTGTVS